jgi:ATP-binding cassette subfamily A (ABC1) protein 5
MILVDGLAPTKALVVHIVFCAVNIFYIPYGIFYWINKQYIICTVQGTCDDQSFGDYLGPEILAMGIALLVQVPTFSAFLILADFLKNGGRVSDIPALVLILNIYSTILFY